MLPLNRRRTRLSIPLGLRQLEERHLNRSLWWRLKLLEEGYLVFVLVAAEDVALRSDVRLAGRLKVQNVHGSQEVQWSPHYVLLRLDHHP